MYLNYWGFDLYPYEIAPDPKFIYYSRDHEEALTRMLYAIERKRGAALLTGEVGCGKTMLSRALIQRLSRGRYNIGLITNPALEPVDFLREVLYQFDIHPGSRSKSDLLKQLGKMILEDFRADRTTLLIIDEAQLICPQTFEEIRLLLNFQFNDQFLLSLILIGQPELRPLIRRIPQFDQRISVRYHINPLNFEEMVRYITFRLTRAGLNRSIFTPSAMEAVYRYSQGVPRKINNICDMSLLIGFGWKAKEIDEEVVHEAIRDSSCAAGEAAQAGYPGSENPLSLQS